MSRRVVIVERDREDPVVWHYGLEGSPVAEWGRLRHDLTTHLGDRLSSEPLWRDPLYPTTCLLVRRDCTVERHVYDLDAPLE